MFSSKSPSSHSGYENELLYNRNGAWRVVFGYLKKECKRHCKFPSSLHHVCRREIYLGVLVHRMTDLLLSNHYINTPGIPCFLCCLLVFPYYLELNPNSQQNKTELHAMWPDLAYAYGSVFYELIRRSLESFNFPSKVGDIIMKYYRASSMPFTLGNYMTK